MYNERTGKVGSPIVDTPPEVFAERAVVGSAGAMIF
jgi:hypothetical protein